MSKTLFEKVRNNHIIHRKLGFPDIVYIDGHFIQGLTSLQAFDGLSCWRIPVFRPLQTIATADHNVPTLNQHLLIQEKCRRKRCEYPSY